MSRQPPSLPRNFLDEIEHALREVEAEVEGGRERLAALEELHAVSLRVSFELDRPVTVFDVILSTPDDTERAHRRELVRLLRAG
jgi:hypothetical protein